MTESMPEKSYPSWNPKDHATEEEFQRLLELKVLLDRVTALEASGLSQSQSENVAAVKNSAGAQFSALWDLISNRAEQAFARSLYRTKFGSVSLGTEEEIRATIFLGTSEWSLFGTVTPIDSLEVLVQITRDVQVSARGDQGEYTIEFRTTPTELTDEKGWLERRLALEAVISTIEKSTGAPLTSRTAGAYRINIFNPKNEVGKISGRVASGTTRHATVGIAAKDIGLPAGAAKPDKEQPGAKQLRSQKLHPFLVLPWYAQKFTEDPDLQGLEDRAKVCYAFVMSATLRLAQIWMRYPGKVHLLEAKSLWGVLPRTPPIKILDSLSQVPGLIVFDLVASRAVPAWAGDWGQVPTADVWNKAVLHILTAGEMGGHPPTAATVGGSPAMLFEYRDGLPKDFDHAWWARTT
jgi:hypothetical protein